MTKLLKILRNSTHIIVEFALIVLIIFAFAIRTSTFQTYLAQKGADYLSEMLATEVTIKKVDIAFYDRIYVDEIYIEDLRGDTLFSIDKIFVNYSLNELKLDHIPLDEVVVDGADAHLRKYKNNNFLNLQFFVDAFKKEDNNKRDFKITADKFSLVNSHFIFDDVNKPKKDFGIDFAHLNLKKITILANNVIILPKEYAANFTKIAFQDKSEFQLKSFKGNALFNNQGLKLGKTSIETNQSNINFEAFQLASTTLADFRSFVDSVAINSKLTTSSVYLSDIAYFAPTLKGMKGKVLLSGSTNNPVDHLSMNNILLKFGEKSIIKGDFYLPDFKELYKDNINQYIDYFYVNVNDLQQIYLPYTSSTRHIKWPTSLNSIQFIEGDKFLIEGSVHDLTVSASRVNTSDGEVVLTDKLNVRSDTAFQTFTIVPKKENKNQIRINNLALNRFFKNSNLKSADGNLRFKKVIISPSNVHLIGLNGMILNAVIFEHDYDYIILDDVNYRLVKGKQPENKVKGHIYVRDENFDMSLEGTANIGKTLNIDAAINIECAMLGQLNPSLKDRGELLTSFDVTIDGTDFTNFNGGLIIHNLFYEEKGNEYSTSSFNGYITRSSNYDSIAIQSDLVDGAVVGNIDYAKMGNNIAYQLKQVFPTLDFNTNKNISDKSSKFRYDITLKQTNDLLAIFYPQLEIATNTHITGNYDGKENNFSLQLNSPYVNVGLISFQGINTYQQVANQELLSLINANSFTFRDTFEYKMLHLTGLSSRGELDAQLIFEDSKGNRSNVQWFTEMKKEGILDVVFYNPSFIYLKDHKWEIDENSHLHYENGKFTIDEFEISHDNQYIAANGTLSDSIKDKLYLDIMGVNIREIGALLGSKRSFSGDLDASCYITTPFTNFRFNGEAIIDSLYVNKTEIGNVGFGMYYDASTQKIDMYGDLFYRASQTFHFDGFYTLNKVNKSKGNLNFNMQFQQMDIAVLNEFLDPDVINDIQGKLNGNLTINGSLEEPVLSGNIHVDKGMFNLAILGANMYFSGDIKAVEDGFFINQMPLKDEEGNMGSVTGTIFHDNFKNFYFEVVADLENHPFKRMPTNPSKPIPLERFLVMNTTYDINSPYYGKAYVTGRAIITGYADDLSIDVTAKTQRGTQIFFPLYGPTTIEDDGFITFKKSGLDTTEIEPKIDLSGVNLDLNFDVNENAEVQLIFDNYTGDAIAAKGEGDINLSINRFNELTVKGTYIVSDGVYNFAVGPYKKDFKIAPGGTVQWVGSPYEPLLDIYAYYKTAANLSPIMADVIQSQSTNNAEIYAYLNVKGNVMQPSISFNIAAPNASDEGKAAIARIKSNPSELNKQFFSLIITKSFMPIYGRKGGNNSGAILDLASQQINNVLDKLAEGYKLNVDLESDNYSGQFSGKFGISKSFLDDRLRLSGAFGVGTSKIGEQAAQSLQNQSMFIGDVKVEYLLNPAGTFRINVFNESNNNYLLQSEGRGHYTQGIGVSYEESFYSLQDFELFQFFANMFRSKDNWIRIRSKNDDKIPIPEEYYNQKTIRKEQ